MLLNGNVKVPRRMTTGSCGYDFFAPDTYELKPGEWTMIDTCVSLTDDDTPYMTSSVRPIPPDGYAHTVCLDYPTRWFMMLVPRSGLSNKYGFRIRNTVGIIDMDYRDTIKAMVTVDSPYTLTEGERFLQGIVVPFGTFIGEIKPVEARTGGHGSTGRY